MVIGTIFPLVYILGFSAFIEDRDPRLLAYILTGNLVLAIMFEIQGKVAGNFAFMKAMGTLNYFGTLPIEKNILIAATAIAFLIMFIPSLIIIIFIGSWLLSVSIKLSPLLLIVIPLCALPMAGIGALIGVNFNRLEESMAFNRLVAILALTIGPVLIPPERLPDILVRLGYLSPATYAASAFRQTIIGPITERLILDLVVLSVFLLIIFLTVDKKIKWRGQ